MPVSGSCCVLPSAHRSRRRVPIRELLQRLAALSGVPERDIGVSGLKDRNAVTRQWFSVGLAGREEPDWTVLQAGGDVQVLQRGRHTRKLRRGVHRANRFRLLLRAVSGDRAALDARSRHPHTKAAQNIIHDIMGSLPNLGFSRLIELAAEADDLPWPDPDDA